MTRVHRVTRALPAVVTALLASIILGPVLLDRGYVLVGDMSFVPDQPWKAAWLGLDGSVPRAVPADAVVSLLGQVVPGDLLQKAILLGTLVLAGLGMLRLVRVVLPDTAGTARLGGAVLYVWNPYVFERLAIGHWGLLVGYAALPWVVVAATGVRREEPHAGARLLLLLAAAAVGSPTGGLLAGLVALVVVVTRTAPARAFGVVLMVLVVNLPWILPGLLNDVAATDAAGVSAFAADADTALGTAVSLVTFGGIWKAAAAPEEREATLLVVAGLVLVLLSLLALLGATRARRPDGPGLGAVRLAALAAAGLVVAGLPATAPVEDLVRWLVGAAPGAGLWRDSQKWLAPFVLVTCLGFAALVARTGRPLRRHGLGAGAVLLALVPVVLLPSLAWGLSGRYQPVAYPSDWHAVRSVLAAVPADERRTAVLPWSAYQRLPWNERRAALDPALRFFPGEVVANDDLDVSASRTVRGEDRTAARITRALADGEPLAPVLSDEGVRFVLVEKTAAGAGSLELPTGSVLHDGDELALIDLGRGTGPAQTTHRTLLLLVDGVAVLAVLAAGLLLTLRKPDPIRYHMSGSSTDGARADYR